MPWMSFQIYRFVFSPIVVLVLKIFYFFIVNGPASWRQGKLFEFLSDRFSTNWTPLEAPAIWVHASSGEIEYAKPLLRELKIKWPQVPIVVTYFSPSAKKLVRNALGIDALAALPIDSYASIDKFLRFYRPRILLIARTDVWPELSYQCKVRKIPSILFSATFSYKTGLKAFLGKPLTQFTFRQLSKIFCVSKQDQEQLSKLDIEAEVAGDTRYDQVLWRLSHPQSVKQELKPNTSDLIVLGSTWPQDEAVILPALASWLSQGGKVVIAPHEINESRLKQIEKNFASIDVACSRYSHSQSWSSPVLLVDQIGCLQELYTWGKLAFVGGSFKDKVHSVMEPLAAGLPVITGPFIANNREALEFEQINAGSFSLVTRVKNSSEFVQAIKKIIANHTASKALLQQEVLNRAGASKRLVDRISGFLS